MDYQIIEPNDKPTYRKDDILKYQFNESPSDKTLS